MLPRARSGRVACEYPPVPEYAKVERWNRWSGPFSDIVQTARDAIVTIEGWHDGADRDAVGDPLRVNTEIDLVDREIQSTFSSVDELAAIDDRDLATIRSIRVRAGWIGAVEG